MNHFKIIKLPPELCPTSKPYVAALVSRDHQATVNAKLYLAKDYAFDGQATESYLHIANIRRFAFVGQLKNDYNADTGALQVESQIDMPVKLACELVVTLDGVDNQLPEVCDYDALDNTLLLFVGGEIMSIARAALVKQSRYYLTVLRGVCGSNVENHKAGQQCFIIRREDLMPITHGIFNATRLHKFKCVIGARDPANGLVFTL